MKNGKLKLHFNYRKPSNHASAVEFNVQNFSVAAQTFTTWATGQITLC